MGHPINTALQALRELQEDAIRGAVKHPECGVCGHVDRMTPDGFDGYEFVREHADDWPQAMHWGDGLGDMSGKLKDYFVPDVRCVGRWQGANLDLRLDLIEFLIEKCEVAE